MSIKQSKSTVETIKTVVIAALISGIICAVVGYQFAQSQASDKQSAVKAAVQSVK